MILVGDVLERLADLDAESVQCCVTSPPYFGLRSYLPAGHPDKAKEVGTERTPEEYTARLVEVFRGVRRVLRRDGCVWLNLGDSFAAGGGGPKPSNIGGFTNQTPVTPSRMAPPGLKPKDLIGIPWRTAFALQADGWYLRQAVTWCKTAPMPESVTDRPSSATEMVFLLTKSARYFYDADAVRVPHARLWDADKNGGSLCGTDGRDQAVIGGHGRAGRAKSEPNPAGRNLWNYWVLSPEQFSARAAGYGTTGITIPDCPVHGDSDLARTVRRQARDGVLRAAEKRRNRRTASRLALEPEAAPVARTSLHSEPGCTSSTEQSRTPGSNHASRMPIGQPSHGDHQTDVGTSDHTSRIAGPGETPHGSSDSPGQSCVPAAMSRSTQSHRTDLAPESDPSYTPSAQTSAHTGGMSALPGFAALLTHNSENSTEEDSASDEKRTGHDQTGLSSGYRCTCPDYYIDHYAVMPQKLAEPCILAGTSEAGCCRVCGAPWERVVERERVAKAKPSGKGWRVDIAMSDANGDVRRGLLADQWQAHTTGWRPTCTHAGEPWPCLVLDPFLGSGTVGLVAERLARRWVGIELDERSAQIARDRTAQLGLGRLLAAGGGES